MVKFDYSVLSGKVITRDDFEYEESRKGWNRAIEKYPLAIVYCSNEEDVKNAILFAKNYSLNIRIRSGGHHYEGYSNGNDALIIDVSKMNKICIDEEWGTVKVQGGVRNRELYEATCSKGYPFPGGGCPTVGVIGFTLGGGWGYSSRMLGFGCDSLIEAELINYKGEIILCNEKCNEDLFWALKGCGGGNFGIVTSMTFKLSEKVDNVTLINIDFQDIDFEENIKLIEVWQEMYKDLDKRANFKMSIYNSRENGRGVKIIGLFYGTKKEANQILSPIKDIVSVGSYSLKDISVLDANRIIQDSHPEYERYKSGGRFIYRDYTREEIIKLLDLLSNMAEGSTYTAITFYGLGGAIAEMKKNSTSFIHRDAKFILGFQSVWEEAKFAPHNRKWVSERMEYIKSITKGSFINFPYEDLDNYGEEYYGENARVLTAIKEKYDKDDFFTFEQDIRIEKKLQYNFVVR